MRLTYIGPFDRVAVPVPGSSGWEIECERDGAAEFPDSVAKGLLEQTDNWQKAPAASARSARKEE